MKYLLVAVFVIVGVSARRLAPGSIEADRKADESKCQYWALADGTKDDWWGLHNALVTISSHSESPTFDRSEREILGMDEDV